jgi:protein-tyrosine phosphatase
MWVRPAHRGTRKILDKYNIPYNGRSRQVTAVDMDPDNYVIAMDDSNMRDLKRRFGEHPRLYRLLDFAQEQQ